MTNNIFMISNNNHDWVFFHVYFLVPWITSFEVSIQRVYPSKSQIACLLLKCSSSGQQLSVKWTVSKYFLLSVGSPFPLLIVLFVIFLHAGHLFTPLIVWFVMEKLTSLSFNNILIAVKPLHWKEHSMQAHNLIWHVASVLPFATPTPAH